MIKKKSIAVRLELDPKMHKFVKQQALANDMTIRGWFNWLLEQELESVFQLKEGAAKDFLSEKESNKKGKNEKR